MIKSIIKAWWRHTTTSQEEISGKLWAKWSKGLDISLSRTSSFFINTELMISLRLDEEAIPRCFYKSHTFYLWPLPPGFGRFTGEIVGRWLINHLHNLLFFLNIRFENRVQRFHKQEIIIHPNLLPNRNCTTLIEFSVFQNFLQISKTQ